MKKLFFILTLVLFGLSSMAQEENYDRIRDKMQEFIQKRLSLSKKEAERFTPVFIRYFREWRASLKESDKLIRQQKIVDIRIRYRNEFRDIVGEKRSNAVYTEQDNYVRILGEIHKERIETRRQRTNRLNELRQ